MKAFIYDNEDYLRVIPAKPLLRSTMVYEVVTRGDVFALHLPSQQLTIIPGTAEVTHFEVTAQRDMAHKAKRALELLNEGDIGLAKLYLRGMV